MSGVSLLLTGMLGVVSDIERGALTGFIATGRPDVVEEESSAGSEVAGFANAFAGSFSAERTKGSGRVSSNSLGGDRWAGVSEASE